MASGGARNSRRAAMRVPWWAIGLLLWLALTIAVAASAPPTGLDLEVARSVGRWAASSDYDWSLPLTDLGGVQIIVAVLLVAAGALAVLGRRREALALLLGVAAGEAVVQLTKVLVARPRPDFSLTESGGFSYPSGHAAASMALYGLLTLLAVRETRGPLRALAATTGALLILAIGATRVYLGAHYPSDVLAGWLAGVLCAAAAWALASRALPPAQADAGSSPRRPTRRPGSKRNARARPVPGQDKSSSGSRCAAT